MFKILALRPNGLQDLSSQQAFSCHAGISLLEVAMVMVIVTIAVAPIIRNLGGPSSSQGNAARMVGMQSKEVVLANTMVEQALANDFKTFNCNAAFDPNTFPSTGQTGNFPAGSRCVNNSYNKTLYYQWTVKNSEQANSLMPTGNKYYSAVLNVYTTPNGGTPLLTLPTSFFWNKSGQTTPQTKTGIMIVQDISGSMVWAQTDGDLMNAANNGNSAVVASPYLRYRYADPSVGYNPPANLPPLNLSQNNQLDIVTAKNADDPATPWDDRYYGMGALGVGPGGGSVSDCTQSSNWNSANWLGSNLYTANLATGNTQRDVLINICNRNPDMNTMLNNNMSRIEAARGSLLNFLLSLEADPTLYQDTKIGFETFSAPNNAAGNNPSGQGYDLRVALESVDASNRYPNMRRSLSWINREGPGQINAYEGTNYNGAIRDGADRLFADSSLSNRLIFLVSDGAPNGPGDDHNSLRDLSTQIGNGSYQGSGGKTATMFTLGLLSNDPDVPLYLRDDLANRTPGGQYFQANNVSDVSSMFDQIKYQIQKLILLSKSNRYNVDF